jgi:hypothetical protein
MRVSPYPQNGDRRHCVPIPLKVACFEEKIYREVEEVEKVEEKGERKRKTADGKNGKNGAWYLRSKAGNGE